jgi:hypothetical protein
MVHLVLFHLETQMVLIHRVVPTVHLDQRAQFLLWYLQVPLCQQVQMDLVVQLRLEILALLCHHVVLVVLKVLKVQVILVYLVILLLLGYQLVPIHLVGLIPLVGLRVQMGLVHL